MLSTVFRPRRLTALLLAALMGLSACSAGASRDDTSRASGTSQSPAADAPASADPATDDHAADGGTDGHATGGHQAPLVKAKRLRPGETRRTIEMASSYTPSAPYGTGTDDYRCFLLDPGLEQDAWLTGTHVVPGNPDVVHHVILFQVAPEDVRKARRKDAGDEGEGWTCFGGTGLQEFQNVNHADWIGAWAPGGDESVIKPGFGVRLAKGSRIVMQVHYNLLAGAAEDVSAAQLRLAPASATTSRCRPCCCPRRSSCRAATSTPRGRCARDPLRWPTSGSASARRGAPPTCCTSCAARLRPRVS
ncbi:MAG: hypothetical protein LT071_11880, partial [Nocardioides sp.]|nr:hypothetical protein [Nocardioides sp.]